MPADASAPERTFSSTRVLGVRVDAVDIATAIALIVDHATTSTSPARYVVKPYVEFFVEPQDPVMDVLNRSWLNLPDGVAVQWAAAYLARPPSVGRLVRTLIDIPLRPQAMADPLPERPVSQPSWKMRTAGCQSSP